MHVQLVQIVDSFLLFSGAVLVVVYPDYKVFMQSARSAFRSASLGPGRGRAFTLLELIVVIALLTLLAVWALPAHGKAGRSGHAVACANNLRQLMAGYLMYAHDNHDIALGGITSDTVPAWCSGMLSTVPDAIDEDLVRNSPTYRYVSSTAVFRCPSDGSSFLYRGELRPRTRSYVVNGFMGPPAAIAGLSSDIFKSTQKLGDLTAPGPSAVYVLIEEHENSINDSHYVPFRDLHQFDNQPWLDAPAGRHGNAAGLAYADGHADIHRWLDSNVQGPLGAGQTAPVYTPMPPPGPRDFAWFTNHIAAFVK
jgi:prepilin-type N-terminal cleavage/methylation domain-containing protein/prepilin-type processing-associated H-X9-DG protein